MKKLALIFLCLIATNVFAGQAYIFDRNHSYIMYEVEHFGFSKQTGRWFIDGQFVLDPEDVTKSKVNIQIPVATVTSDIPELDKHLRGKLFFEVDKFPVATFHSTEITKTGDDTAILKGTLTLKGIKRPVEIKVKLNKKGINPITQKETLGLSGKTTIQRSDFGMATLLPGVSDDVVLSIEAEAYKPDEKK